MKWYIMFIIILNYKTENLRKNLDFNANRMNVQIVLRVFVMQSKCSTCAAHPLYQILYFILLLFLFCSR